jgi:hypothetical protein
VPAQLPPDVAGFTGRAGHLAELDALLADAVEDPTAVPIAAVSGSAGIGKTALAVHWAHRVADRFPDGQLHLDLRGFHRSRSALPPQAAIQVLLQALGVPPERLPTDPDAGAALYRSLLAGKRMLIVLDNARDSAQVRPLLPGSPSCLAVVTSRNQLTGLLTIEAARPLTLDLLTLAEGRGLLTHRLGEDRVAAEPAAVQEIIAGCARLPLALAIMAARAASHPGFALADLAENLRQAPLDVLACAPDGVDIRGVFSRSYRHLGPEAGMYRAGNCCGASFRRD